MANFAFLAAMKREFSAFIVLLLSSVALARPLFVPPDFALPDGRGRATFVDFEDATYHVTYDIAQKRARVRSLIHFRNDRPGQPVFDLVDEPEKLKIDGRPSRQALIRAPIGEANDEVFFRVMTETLVPGRHALEVEHELQAFPPRYGPGRVRSGFFLWDLDPRGLKERYLPSNLEYDQFAMRIEVEAIGAGTEHMFFSNGRVQQLGRHRWSVEFPKFYNSSAPYFHLRPRDETSILRFEHQSHDGRRLPVIVYKDSRSSEALDSFRTLIAFHLSQFEKRFGPFPHSGLVVYNTNTGEGAMEYSGAAFTNLEMLAHELAHSYFGRGVMSANGNAGWIDEAMATYLGGPFLGHANELTSRASTAMLAGHSPYFRANDSSGYTRGVELLSRLDQFLGGKGRTIDGFLADWFSARARQVTTTAILQKDLERYGGVDLSLFFRDFVYGNRGRAGGHQFAWPTDRFHRPMTSVELWQVQ